MGKKDKRIKELEAEVERLRAELESKVEAEKARRKSEIAEIEAGITVGELNRMLYMNGLLYNPVGNSWKWE